MYAFRKGVCPGPLCESIIRNRPRTFAEIRRRAVEHIASEGEVCEKRTSVVPSRPRAQTRAQPVRVNETTTRRKKPEGRRPYETCTVLVVGSDDVAASYYEGVLSGAHGWQKGRKSGGSSGRQVLSWRAPGSY